MYDDTITVVSAGTAGVPAHPRLRSAGHAETGAEAVAKVLTEVPDVLVLDARIVDPDARSVCRRIREWAPATQILAVSDLDDEAVYTTLIAGAMGAVLSSVGPHDLAEAVIATARGESVLQARMAFRILHDIDQWAERSADPLYPPPTLTATEREVLGHLGAGKSPATIAASHAVTPHLVNLHASYAVSKLHRYVHGAAKISAYGA
ncbi:MAG: response regulator transcription factor [Actinomycetota bacterium]